MSSLREECGVFGVYSGETSDVASTAYYGLFSSTAGRNPVE